MKKALIVFVFAGLTLTACGSGAEKLNEAGNEAYANNDYAAAVEKYQEAATADPELAAPLYNTANALYRQEAYDQVPAALQVAMAHADETLTQQSHYNLGNSLFKTEDYEGAAEAYKEALRFDPQDQDAKVNLELTLKQLQQQTAGTRAARSRAESEDQQNEDQQNQDQQKQNQEQDQQNQDQQEGQDQQDQQDQRTGSTGPGRPGKSGRAGPGGRKSGSRRRSREPGSANSDGHRIQDQEQPQDQQIRGQEQPQEPEQQDDPQEGQDGDRITNRRTLDRRIRTAGAGDQPEEPQEPQPGLGQLAEQLEGLSEEQARQLLIAASQGTETLQEYLQQIYLFPNDSVEQDW